MINPRDVYRGKTTLYISHGADTFNPDWFLVMPNPIGLGAEVEKLARAGRTVYVIKAKPWRPRWRWWFNRENFYYGRTRAAIIRRRERERKQKAVQSK